MSIYPDQGYGPDAGDDTLRALLKSLEILNLQGIVASPFPEGTLALAGDDERRAAIKINAALFAGQGSGGGGSITPEAFAALDLDNLPTSDPGGGKPWLNGGVVQVGP